MPRTISEAMGVSPARLESQGVFDGFVDIDAKLYVDPTLLAHTAAPELATSYTRFRNHFLSVIRLLRSSRQPGDATWRQAVRLLTFRERAATALGYCLTNTAGSGIGADLAHRLATTASQIILAGIEDPRIFELVGLFEEGIGADRTSDMTISIIWPDLLAYSQRIATNLEAPSIAISHDNRAFSLPCDPNTSRSLVLFPADILVGLPVAHDWDDVDVVCTHNATLRARVNPIIGRTWRDATRRAKKRDLKDAILQNPELLRDLIRQYAAKTPRPYDLSDDPLGEVNWHKVSLSFASQHPLDLSADAPVTGARLLPVVVRMCEHFRQLLENNNLAELLYDRARRLKPERAAHLLFYGIAHAYCEANNLDLSPEANAGRGSIDFKVSRGYEAKVNVEVKYSSNTHLRRGWDKQLPVYNTAEGTSSSIYLIIQTTESTRVIDAIRTSAREQRASRQPTPEVIVADGRLRPSASRA